MAIYTINNLPAPIDFECNNDPLKRTLQNAKNLLMCAMGEVPYDRLRGMDPAIHDMNMEELRNGVVREVERALLWEPDVRVRKAAAVFDEKGELMISAEIECRIGE